MKWSVKAPSRAVWNAVALAASEALGLIPYMVVVKRDWSVLMNLPVAVSVTFTIVPTEFGASSLAVLVASQYKPPPPPSPGNASPMSMTD